MTTCAMTPLAWALAYAAYGLAVIPVAADKRPITTHGLKDATRDPAIIEGWWRRWPYADSAWALPATVVVVDIDVKAGKNGYRDFERLDGRDPRTVVTPSTSTPSGGLQNFYAASKLYRNRVAVERTGVDLRTEGGYVVLPGCRNGRKWLKPLRTTPLLPAPAWLDRTLNEARSPPDPLHLHAPSSNPSDRKPGLAELEHACAKIILAPNGSQENVRHAQCFYLGALIGRGELDYETAYAACLAAARAMPTYRDSWRDLERRVERSIKAGIGWALVP
jgi:putative DNA primase/helicase